MSECNIIDHQEVVLWAPTFHTHLKMYLNITTFECSTKSLPMAIFTYRCNEVLLYKNEGNTQNILNVKVDVT